MAQTPTAPEQDLSADDAPTVAKLLAQLRQEAHRAQKDYRALLIWEEEDGAHRDALLGIADEAGIAVVDATQAELTAKRRLLRGDLAPAGPTPPDASAPDVLIYRAGPVPPPQRDLIHDLKLQALPFVPDVAIQRAADCGADPSLARVLREHAGFFSAQKRVDALNASPLPKGTEEELLAAMAVACCEAVADQGLREAQLDAIRRVVMEHASPAAGAKRLGALKASGLEGVFWDMAADALHYHAPEGQEPSLDNLEHRLLLTAVAPLVPEATLKAHGGALAPEALRILRTVFSSDRATTARDGLLQKHQAAVASLVSPALRTPENIGELDLLPVLDVWVLATLAQRAEAGARAKDVRDVAEARSHGLWAKSDRFAPAYQAVVAGADLLEGVRLALHELPGVVGVPALFAAYTERWHQVDAAYRRFHTAWPRLSEQFQQQLRPLKDKLDSRYSEFLVSTSARWQQAVEQDLPYPPEGVPSSLDFFRREVLSLSPGTAQSVAVIACDALRYECGQELAHRLRTADTATLAKRSRSTVTAMASALPSYTQLGMAALLPRAPVTFAENHDTVLKGGQSTQGAVARQRLLQEAVPGAQVLSADDALNGGVDEHRDAPLLYVFQNTIDARGDKLASESKVFLACEEAFDEVAKLTALLLRKGFDHVLVTADHGFLYEEAGGTAYQDASVPALAARKAASPGSLAQSRRYIVSDELIADDQLINLGSSDVMLEKGAELAFPKGTLRLPLQGSGKRYAHGGISLQENVLPVVHVRKVSEKAGSRPVGARLFPSQSNPAITGQSIVFELYQAEPVSADVRPATVRVGLYGAEGGPHAGELLSVELPSCELTSPSASSADRRRTLELHLTGAVDDCTACELRAERLDPISGTWETLDTVTYAQERAFGGGFFDEW